MQANPAVIIAQLESINNGIKVVCAREVRKKKSAIRVVNYNEQSIFASWKAMYARNQFAELRKLIWAHVENSPQLFYKECNSGDLGLYTTIAPYTNKQGKIHQAHFTVNGKYYGPVSKLGETPVSYEGYFKIEKSRFEIQLCQLNNLQNEIEMLFVPKTMDSVVDELFEADTVASELSDMETAQILTDNESITTADDIFGDDSDDDIPIQQLLNKKKTPQPPRNGPGNKVILRRGPDGKLYRV